MVTKAAKQGHVRAASKLGLLYVLGVGVDQDYAEGVKWLKKAAERNDLIAQGTLAAMYSVGQGVSKDLNEANRWRNALAEQSQRFAKIEQPSNQSCPNKP
ncbi:MAG TPA: tetratricopeptide repeat protein [Beijerinckiaceae bacterium]|nr:tetratricopeptide repeat protein [Beijerinckiaceae bacterium]